MTEEAKEAPKLGKVQITEGELTPEQMEEIESGEYFTVAQIATKLRYTGAWILKLVQDGRIKGVKPLGGRWRVPRSEYEKLIKEGIPPLPREPSDKPSVTQIEVADEKVIDKVREPEAKKGPPGVWPFDFSKLFGGKRW